MQPPPLLAARAALLAGAALLTLPLLVVWLLVAPTAQAATCRAPPAQLQLGAPLLLAVLPVVAAPVLTPALAILRW